MNFWFPLLAFLGHTNRRGDKAAGSMYPQLGLHIDSEMEFRVIFGPRDLSSAPGLVKLACALRAYREKDDDEISRVLKRHPTGSRGSISTGRTWADLEAHRGGDVGASGCLSCLVRLWCGEGRSATARDSNVGSAVE